MKRTAIPAVTIALTLLSSLFSDIPVYAHTNPSEYIGAENPAHASYVSATDNKTQDIYVLDADFDKAKVMLLAANNAATIDSDITTSNSAITTSESAITTSGGAVSTTPAAVDMQPLEENNPNNETNASIRMKPLKDKLSALTAADISNQAAKLKDIGKHWSKESVAKLSKLDIVNGYTDGTFRPENTVTVAEFIKMAVTALGYKPGINSKYWAQNYIDYAIKDKLIKKGDFSDYNKPITREWVASISVNAAMLYDKAPTHDMDNVVVYRLKDYKEVKDTLKQKVIDANLLGLMSAYSSTGKFMPKSNLTKAESATVILRLLDSTTRTAFVPKTTEAFKVKALYEDTYSYVVNSGHPEVLGNIYKINEAIKKTKGYGSSRALDQYSMGFILAAEKENIYDLGGFDLSMKIATYAINADDTAYTMPYTMTLRNPENIKKYHMDAMKAIFQIFYGNDTDKVMTEFIKILNSAIAGDDTFYEIATYKTGIKYNNRGIRLARGKYDPDMVIWIYSK